MLNRLRNWLILKLAGNSTAAVNCQIDGHLTARGIGCVIEGNTITPGPMPIEGIQLLP